MPSGTFALHPNQGRCGVLRASDAKPRQTPQLFVVANAVAVIMGLAGVIALAIVKSDDSSKRFIASNQLPIANTVILCFCITILLLALLLITRHAGKTRRHTWCGRGCTLLP